MIDFTTMDPRKIGRRLWDKRPEMRLLTDEEKKALYDLIPRPDRNVLLNAIKKQEGKPTTLPVVNEAKIAAFEAKIAKLAENCEPVPNSDDPVLIEFINTEIEEFMQKQLNNPDIRRERKCSLVVGPPGAGKSTTIKQLEKDEGAFHIDADSFKEKIAKKFNCNVNDEIMQSISVGIADRIAAEAEEHGLNYIRERIGDEPYWLLEDTVDKLINKPDGRKYSVGLSLVHVSEEISRNRNLSRGEEALAKDEPPQPPRFVRDKVLKGQGESALLSYLCMAKTCPELFSYMRAYSNECPYREEVDEKTGEKITKPPISLKSLSIDQGQKLGEQTDLNYKGVYDKAMAAHLKTTRLVLVNMHNKNESDKSVYLVEKFDKLCYGNEEEKQAVRAFIKEIRKDLNNGIARPYEEEQLVLLYNDIIIDTRSTLETVYDPKNIAEREILEDPETDETKQIVRNFAGESIAQLPEHNPKGETTKQDLVTLKQSQIYNTLGYENPAQSQTDTNTQKNTDTNK